MITIDYLFAISRLLLNFLRLFEMAGSRKKGDYSVLAEINTEEDWDNLCTREVSRLLNKRLYS